MEPVRVGRDVVRGLRELKARARVCDAREGLSDVGVLFALTDPAVGLFFVVLELLMLLTLLLWLPLALFSTSLSCEAAAAFSRCLIRASAAVSFPRSFVDSFVEDRRSFCTLTSSLLVS
jgi:hypothetical protein